MIIAGTLAVACGTVRSPVMVIALPLKVCAIARRSRASCACAGQHAAASITKRTTTASRPLARLSVLARGGVLDLAARLQPCHREPAPERPCRAQRPSGQHIGRPVHAEIDPA